jgi:hypothetical protein
MASYSREIVVIGSVSASCPLFMRRSVTTLRGVAEETARLPQGWKDRLVAVQNENTRLETVDLDPTIRERVRSRIGRAFGG